MKTRTTRVTLTKNSVSDSDCFDIEIIDEGGEYLVISCGINGSSITIDPSEWPFLRDAIDRMFVEIAENERGDVEKAEPDAEAPLGAETSEPTASEADGWIPWEGGECPVEYRTAVDVIFRNGDGAEFKWPAGGHRWGHTGMFTDIIAYKVVE
jgi:hypothetical protein